MNVIELRSSDWGRAPKDAQASSNSTTGLGVYYGPDGQALTVEEQDFLSEGIGRQDDEEEDYEYVLLRLIKLESLFEKILPS